MEKKNPLGGFYTRLDIREENISELHDSVMETVQTKSTIEKEKEKTEKRTVSVICGLISSSLIDI